MSNVVAFRKPDSPSEYVELFLFEKKAQGRAPRTLKDYKSHLQSFFKRFPGALRSEKDLRHSVLEYFADDVKPATFNIRRAYLKSFFDFLTKEGVISANPIDFARRKDEGRARAINEEKLRRFLEAIDRKSYAGLRDYALIVFILDTGVRPGEALKLKREDFSFSSLEVTIPAQVAKTRRKRTVPISPITAKEIKRLLTVRPAEWRDAPVFCSFDGGELTEGSFGARMRSYSQKAGCKITPYDLRHSFAITYLRNGGNVFALQRTLGHADLNMTRRYLALTGEDLKREHTKATPIANIFGRVRKVKL